MINNQVDSGRYQCRVVGRTLLTTFSVLSDQPVRSFSGHTGRPREEEYDEIELDHETDLSYDVSGQFAGDQYVLRAIQEAQRTVDRALNSTVELLFERGRHSDRTPGELLNIFRYPSATERELARAGEIYIRTLELVETKVKEGAEYNLSTFSLDRLISPANLELIGNLSGCEAARRFADCEDLCYHSQFR